MIFPVETQKQENGCIAVVLGASRWNQEQRHANLTFRARVKFEGRIWQGPRLSYHLNKHRIFCTPPSLKTGVVLHSCDNKWCVNPEHLSLGDASTNQKEAVKRNLASAAGRVKGGNSLWRNMTKEKREEMALKKSLTMKRILAEKRRFAK